MKIFDRNADACVVSRVGLVALLASILLAAAPSRAAVAESDIAQDSVLELAEVASGGSYQTLNVRLEIRSGRATLAATKDGERSEVELPIDDALALWRSALASDLETLPDSKADGVAADQSRFTVGFRAGNAANSFTVYGVDSIEDRRYRDIVRAILRATDAHVYGKVWRD